MKKKILIVVDMQNDFIDGSLGSTQATKIVPNVINKINNFNGIVLYTKDTHYDTDIYTEEGDLYRKNYMETLEGKNLPVIHCVKDSKGWEINDLVKEALNKKLLLNDEILQEKHNYEIIKETFGYDSWEECFKSYGINGKYDIDSIELVGLCTGICVSANAIILRALYPNVPITVDSTCCACVSEESNKTALEAMKLQQIEII